MTLAPIPETLRRYVREGLPPLSPEQQARKDASREAHARLRPVWDQSTYDRLMRSNPEEVRREMLLMEQGGAPEHAFSIHRQALRELNEIRRAKYGRENSVEA